MDIFKGDLKLGHQRIMENFTSESLKKFIGQGEASHQASLPSPGAHSARGQRVSEVLRNRGGQGQSEAKESLDTLIRQNMGEMVRQYMQADKLQELKVVMEEHGNFIREILSLIENSTKKKKA